MHQIISVDFQEKQGKGKGKSKGKKGGRRERAKTMKKVTIVIRGNDEE